MTQVARKAWHDAASFQEFLLVMRGGNYRLNRRESVRACGGPARDLPSADVYRTSVLMCRGIQGFMDNVRWIEHRMVYTLPVVDSAQALLTQASAAADVWQTPLVDLAVEYSLHVAARMGWTAILAAFESAAARLGDVMSAWGEYVPHFASAVHSKSFIAGTADVARPVRGMVDKLPDMVSLLAGPASPGDADIVRAFTTGINAAGLRAARALDYLVACLSSRDPDSRSVCGLIQDTHEIWRDTVQAVRPALRGLGDAARGAAVGWGCAVAVFVAAVDRFVGACGRRVGVEAWLPWRIADLVDESLP